MQDVDSVPGSNSNVLVAQVWKEIRSDSWFYACTIVYVLAAGLSATWLDAEHLWQPLLYVDVLFLRAFGLLSAAVILLAAARGMVRQPHAPLSGMVASIREPLDSLKAWGPRLCAGCLMFCAFAVFYGTFTSVKNMLPLLAPFAWDPPLAELDRVLHGGVDPGPVLAGMLGTALIWAIDYVYAVGWTLMLVGISLWAAISTRHSFLRQRFFFTLMVSWILFGNVIAGIFLSAGPVYYGGVTGDATRFADLTSSIGGVTAEIQHYLWTLHLSGNMNLGSGISAFPSMHLAAATLFMLFLWSVSKPLGLLGAAFVVIIQIGSVLLGWHYAVDGYFSIVGTMVLWWLYGAVAARLGRQSEAASSARAAAPA